jgi:hypothetical protein
MKGKYGGPISVDDLYQALYQDRGFFDSHRITHVRNAALYFTPCDEFGQPVLINDELGNPIDGYVSAGAYRSAADAFDRAHERRHVETRPIVRQAELTAAPFSPL